MEDRKGLGSAAAYAAALRELSSGDAPLPGINPDASAKIAQAYEVLKHNPDDPAVQKAYKALIDETVQQYKGMQDAGMKISKIKEGMENPYPSSKAMIKDVGENKHLWYYPTEQGFGSSGTSSAKHPMLQATDLLDNEGKPMLANDVFRAVHDYEGHYKGNNKFGALGEERAYQQHKKAFSPEAVKALTTETRGQNSWVNYGPKGVENRANPAATTYADQKAGLLPDWASKNVDEIASPLKYQAKSAARTALRTGLPALALAEASDAETLDEGLMKVLIPGGLGQVGEDREEEAALMGEIQGAKDYPQSQARRDALQALKRPRK
jgi:hypothetical protein